MTRRLTILVEKALEPVDRPFLFTVVEQTHRMNKFIDPFSKGIHVIHRRLRYRTRDLNRDSLSFVAEDGYSRWLHSVSSPQLTSETYVVRGANTDCDTMRLVGTLSQLSFVVVLVCLYNQLHTNNVLSCEDYKQFIQTRDPAVSDLVRGYITALFS